MIANSDPPKLFASISSIGGNSRSNLRRGSHCRCDKKALAMEASRSFSRDMKLLEKDLVYSVVGAGFKVYNELGFGFREHVYQLALERELLARGHRVAREVNV